MENLSQPVEKVAVPQDLPVPGYWRDHHVGSLAVLPAVEALQILARSKPAAWCADPHLQEGALFHHPLTIDPAVADISVLQEHERYADGSCLSRLTSIRRTGNLSRRMEHLRVRFLPATADDSGGREDSVSGRGYGQSARTPEGVRLHGDEAFDVPGGRPERCLADPADESVFRVSGGCLYEALVPFGPAYRNARGDVLLTQRLVSASVYGGDFPAAEGPLGSPFPLDGAMHAACAWGQRYRNRVVFPVGFDRREIFHPTRTGETYGCRISPLTDDGSVLCFDLWLYDPDGRLAEAVRGLRMKEILGGKLKPPVWIREGM